MCNIKWDNDVYCVGPNENIFQMKYVNFMLDYQIIVCWPKKEK